jgi:hypothetical protein
MKIEEIRFAASGFRIQDGCVIIQDKVDGHDFFASCRVIAVGELAE